MAFISEGSLGLRCSLRLDTDDDFPRLKKERQLPTGDFFILLGGLFLECENRANCWRGKLHGRMRSRSMCSVRYGRNYRGVETFCYGWPQRSRTLKPVLYTDLVVSRLQSRRKKKPVSGGPGERGAPREDAQRPAPRRGCGRADGRTDGQTRPDSRRPARCESLSPGMDVASSQPHLPPLPSFCGAGSPSAPLRPGVPVSNPAILPHPTPSTGVAGARQDLGDIAPLTMV